MREGSTIRFNERSVAARRRGARRGRSRPRAPSARAQPRHARERRMTHLDRHERVRGVRLETAPDAERAAVRRVAQAAHGRRPAARAGRPQGGRGLQPQPGAARQEPLPGRRLPAPLPARAQARRAAELRAAGGLPPLPARARRAVGAGRRRRAARAGRRAAGRAGAARPARALRAAHVRGQLGAARLPAAGRVPRAAAHAGAHAARPAEPGQRLRHRRGLDRVHL